MHEVLWEKQSREYLSLKEEVKASRDRYEIEWIVKREAGNPKEYCGRHDVSFSHGQLGWLGNMSPAEEYYYLSAAIVVQGAN